MAQDRIDISHLSFTSRVFPTAEDMALWNSLSPAEQRAVILRDVEAGLKSPAVAVSAADLMHKALSRQKRNAG